MLAKLFIDYHEKRWLSGYSNKRPLWFKRYVNDIFKVFNTYHKTVFFFEYLSSRHPNIKFTMETEIDKQLPFHDLFISKVEII